MLIIKKVVLVLRVYAIDIMLDGLAKVSKTIPVGHETHIRLAVKFTNAEASRDLLVKKIKEICRGEGLKAINV